MSSAVHSEVIELVLSVDKFDAAIAKANTGLQTLVYTSAQSINLFAAPTNEMLSAIDRSINRILIQNKELKAGNDIVEARRKLLTAVDMFGPLGGKHEDHNSGQLAMVSSNNRIAAAKTSLDIQEQETKQLREQLRLEEQRSAIEAKNAAHNSGQLAMVGANNRMAEAARVLALEEKNTNEFREQLRLKEKQSAIDAKNAAHNARQLAMIKPNADKAAVAAKAKEHELYKESLRVAEKISAEEQRLLNMLRGERLERAILIHQANAQYNLERDRAAAAAIAARKGNIGYAVGSTVLGGKTGALFTAASSAAFATGATNLGAMFYTMERFSYATGIGTMKIGTLAAKLGLVQTNGAGAGASIAKFGIGLIGVSGALVAIAATIGTLLAGNKLDKALANASTLMADASVQGYKFNAMIQDMSTSAGKLSAAFGVDIVEVVNGFKTALSTGIAPEDLERFSQTALNMAKGLGASFEQSISILTTFKDAFAGTIEDTVGYSDVLFNAINVGKFNIEQLNANVGRVAVTAAEAGVSFKDMMAALSTLNRVGMSTSQAITSLNQFIVSLVNPTDKAKKAMDALGISYGGAALRGRSLLAVVADIKAKVGNRPDLYGDIFGEERGRRGAIGMAANPALMASNREEMEKIGTAAAAAGRAMDTFGQALYKAFIQSWNAIQQTGETLLNLFNEAFKGTGQIELLGKVLASTFSVAGGALVILVAGALELYEVVVYLIGSLSTLGSIFYNIAHLNFKGVIAAMDEWENKASATWSRMKAIYNAAEEGIATVSNSIWGKVSGNKASEAKDAVKGVFDEMRSSGITSLTSLVEESDKLWDHLEKTALSTLEKIAEAQKKLAAAAFANNFTDKFWKENKPAPPPTNPGELGFINRIAAIDQIERDNDGKLSEELKIERNIAKKRVIALRKIREEAYAEELKDLDDLRKKKLNEALKAKGFDEIIYPDLDAKPPKEDLNTTDVLESKIKSLTDAHVALDKISSGASALTENKVEEYKKALDAARQYYAELSTYAKDNAATMTIEQAERIKRELAIIDTAILKADGKLKGAVEARYLKEYNFQNTIYNAKMKMYDEETTRLTALGNKYKEQELRFKKIAAESKANNRTAGQQRRDYGTAIEEQTKVANSTQDPAKFDKILDHLAELLDKFKAAGTAAGEKTYTDKEAARLAEAIEAIAAKRGKEIEESKKKVDGQRDKAGKDRDTALQDNPIYKAVRVEAMKVVKDALDTAATHGIAVNGDLNSEVSFGNISVNLPVNDIRKAITDTVKLELAQFYRDVIKKKPNGVNDGNLPAGSALP